MLLTVTRFLVGQSTTLKRPQSRQGITVMNTALHYTLNLLAVTVLKFLRPYNQVGSFLLRRKKAQFL